MGKNSNWLCETNPIHLNLFEWRSGAITKVFAQALCQTMTIPRPRTIAQLSNCPDTRNQRTVELQHQLVNLFELLPFLWLYSLRNSRESRRAGEIFTCKSSHKIVRLQETFWA